MIKRKKYDSRLFTAFTIVMIVNPAYLKSYFSLSFPFLLWMERLNKQVYSALGASVAGAAGAASAAGAFCSDAPNP